MEQTAGHHHNAFDALFISPHFDDAVLSAAHTILHYTNRHKRVMAITVFTRGSDAVSDDIRSFLKESGGYSARTLFPLREKEDTLALKVLGVTGVCRLGLPDGLFRTYDDSLIYPSFTDLFSGTIHKKDSETLRILSRELHTIERRHTTSKTAIYTCLGVGNHADHLLVHKAASAVFGTRAIYWEDVPYRTVPDKLYSRLSRMPSLIRSAVNAPLLAPLKKTAVRKYATQLSGLYHDGLGDIDYLHEVLYAKKTG